MKTCRMCGGELSTRRIPFGRLGGIELPNSCDCEVSRITLRYQNTGKVDNPDTERDVHDWKKRQAKAD